MCYHWVTAKGLHLTRVRQSPHQEIRSRKHFNRLNTCKAVTPFGIWIFTEMQHETMSHNTQTMNSMKLVIPLYFISWKKKTPNDAVTPQQQSQFIFILYILFYVLFYKIITDYIFVNFDVKNLIVFVMTWIFIIWSIKPFRIRIHTKDESKHCSVFAFIFGVNWPVQWI